MAAIDYLKQHGLNAAPEAGKLKVWPANRLTKELRLWINNHKTQLIAECTRHTYWLVELDSETFPMIKPAGMTVGEAREAAHARWPGAHVIPRGPRKAQNNE